jgi:cytochrome c-type biogenesis protein CcmH/NrfG
MQQPTNATGWIHLANAEVATGNPLTARHCFERAIELEPESVDVLLHFAAFLYAYHERATALVLVDRLLARAPHDRDARALRARILDPAAPQLAR